MEARTAVLLGAGASADAGLPLTFQLAGDLIDRANSADRSMHRAPGWVRALNFVYGAMVGYQSEDGSNPRQAVNIERLISALRLLQDAKGHEVAPFVASWKPGALGVGTVELDRSLGRNAVKAVNEAVTKNAVFAERPMLDAIADIARSVAGGGVSTAFEEAERHLLNDLSVMLGRIESVSYLTPLAALAREQRGGLDVLTLNYDLSVEKMCSETATAIDCGIERWQPGRRLIWSPEDGRINLYKLHGSLDWVQRSQGDQTSAPAIELATTDEKRVGADGLRAPWIVVGEREKLATDGPTLALLRGAEDALDRATHLAVIGYSFGDAHINAVIRNWMLGDIDRTISIVDPGWDPLNPGEFAAAILKAYGADSRLHRAPRLAPIVEIAATGLSAALHPLQGGAASASAQVQVEDLGQESNLVRICLRLETPDIFGLIANVEETDSGQSRTHNIAVATSQHAYNSLETARTLANRRVSVDRWRKNEELVIYAAPSNLANTFVKIRGYPVDSARIADFRVSLGAERCD
ncbi:SIR2 family protein [Promicromonospora sp. NPDC050249]|uniref:SIR2 family protein n=1 Tax=Promicromonospora sp. NPDC050249 TaxID=3154743 RepID=UPI00340A4CAE